ncbi:hypothetical protein GCM10009092_19370 [Bowmanella denitrificans]|uniref:RecBCD enzyme subunit RecD n=1 Tax=Bowmanella denitrificans TaxID=366582 RepID=A0ABN0X4W3_9ALTE
MLDSRSYLKPLLAAEQLPVSFTGLDVGLGDFIATREAASGDQFARQLGVFAAIVSQQLASQHVCVRLGELTRLYNLCVPMLDQPLPMLFVSQVQELLSQAATVHLVTNNAVAAARPLVLDGQGVYLQRYWWYEYALGQSLKQLAQGQIRLDTQGCKAQLDQLFAGTSEPRDWQKLAVALAATRRLCVITGGPGTGKTTTVTKLMALVQGLNLAAGLSPLRIVLAAPTGKAAARLAESILQAKSRLNDELAAHLPTQAATLHRLLGFQPGKAAFRHHVDNPLALDMLILDEASMVDLPLMAKLLAALPGHARLVLLGDRQQLASVEVGSVLGDICQSLAETDWLDESGQYDADTTALLNDLTGANLTANGKPSSLLQNNLVMLRKSHRFSSASGVGQLAQAINSADMRRMLACLQSETSGEVDWYAKPTQGQVVELVCRLLQDYFIAVEAGDVRGAFTALMRQQLLCATRQGLWGTEQFNARIELELTRRGWVKPTQELYPGCPLMVSQNDYQVKLFNGDMGICLADQDGLLKVWFMQADGELRAVLPSRVPAWQKLYAMTIHKSQGSEFEHALICLPDGASSLVSRELLYTGVTRAKQKVSLFAPESQLKAALTSHCQRGSGLADRLKISTSEAD